jgi:hypothetical protein
LNIKSHENLKIQKLFKNIQNIQNYSKLFKSSLKSILSTISKSSKFFSFSYLLFDGVIEPTVLCGNVTSSSKVINGDPFRIHPYVSFVTGSILISNRY